MSETKPTTCESGKCVPPLVLFIWVSSLAWLVFGLLAGFLGALKMHATALFSGISFLNYGVLSEVSETALIYGFAIQAIFGGTIWATCRLTNDCPAFLNATSIGTGVWNKLLTVGIVQIFMHGTTGLPLMSLSPSIMLGMVISSIFIVIPWISKLVNLQGENKVSRSYLLVALLIFPLAALPAGHYVFRVGIEGVMQNAIALWYAHTLIFTLVPTFLIGISLFLIEEDSELKDYSIAVPTAALWCIVLGGFLGGLYHGFPVGGAVNSLSVSSTWFPAFGAASLFFVLNQVSGRNSDGANFVRTFGCKWIIGGVAAALILNALGSYKSFAPIFGLTTFKVGIENFIILGALLMGLVFMIRNGLKGDFKPSGILCLGIYFGSLLCLIAYLIEGAFGSGTGLRLHIMGLLILLVASSMQIISYLSSLCVLLMDCLKGCCSSPNESTKSTNLASA